MTIDLEPMSVTRCESQGLNGIKPPDDATPVKRGLGGTGGADENSWEDG